LRCGGAAKNGVAGLAMEKLLATYWSRICVIFAVREQAGVLGRLELLGETKKGGIFRFRLFQF